MNKYFTEINHKNSTLYEHFLTLNPTYQEISQYPRDWLGSELDRDVYLSDPFLSAVNDEFPIKYAGFLKMLPSTVYKWHRDRIRTLSINMLFTAHDESHCLFTSEDQDLLQVNVSELNYKKDTFYLFNTQELHTVINLSQTRYLFSVELDVYPPYSAVVKWADRNGWTTNNE